MVMTRAWAYNVGKITLVPGKLLGRKPGRPFGSKDVVPRAEKPIDHNIPWKNPVVLNKLEMLVLEHAMGLCPQPLAASVVSTFVAAAVAELERIALAYGRRMPSDGYDQKRVVDHWFAACERKRWDTGGML